MSKPGGINHDVAAQLLGITPGELNGLVRDGHVRRLDANSYSAAAAVQDYIAYVKSTQTRREERPTQAEIAAHLDISDRRLRELLTEWGLDHKQATQTELRQRYIRKLREEAAGRATTGPLDLATERARLASEQADRVAMQNAISRKELGPISLISEVLAKIGSRAGKMLDTIPGAIRRREPGITADTLREISAIVAEARNKVANLSLADLKDDDEEETGEEA